MTKIFNKYEFTPTEWATLRKLIEQTTTNPDGGETTTFVNCAVVELGFLPITPRSHQRYGGCNPRSFKRQVGG